MRLFLLLLLIHQSSDWLAAFHLELFKEKTSATTKVFSLNFFFSTWDQEMGDRNRRILFCDPRKLIHTIYRNANKLKTGKQYPILIFVNQSCAFSGDSELGGVSSEQTESLWNHITTDHKEEEQLEDRRNVGENSYISGDGTHPIASGSNVFWYSVGTERFKYIVQCKSSFI
jgi:hypothetical protein